MGKATDAFHAHLDVCKQCRDHPFGLCKIGDTLIRATAEEEAIEGAYRIFGLTAPSSSDAKKGGESQ